RLTPSALEIRTNPRNGFGKVSNPGTSSRNSARWPEAGMVSDPFRPVDDPSRRDRSNATVVDVFDGLTIPIPVRTSRHADASTYQRNAVLLSIDGTPASETVMPSFVNEKMAIPTGAAEARSGVAWADPTWTVSSALGVVYCQEARGAIR